MSRGRTQRLVLRSPWASLVISTLGLMGLAVGVSYFADPAAGPVVRATFGAPITLACLWVATRPWFLRVVIRSDEVVLHKMFRNRHLPRDGICGVALASVDGPLGDAHSVGFIVDDDRIEAVMSMASYQWGCDLVRHRASRQVETARRALGL